MHLVIVLRYVMYIREIILTVFLTVHLWDVFIWIH